MLQFLTLISDHMNRVLKLTEPENYCIQIPKIVYLKMRMETQLLCLTETNVFIITTIIFMIYW